MQNRGIIPSRQSHHLCIHRRIHIYPLKRGKDTTFGSVVKRDTTLTLLNIPIHLLFQHNKVGKTGYTIVSVYSINIQTLARDNQLGILKGRNPISKTKQRYVEVDLSPSTWARSYKACSTNTSQNCDIKY